MHLDLTANHQLVVIDDDDSNVTCVSSLNSSSTLSWYRVSGAQEAIVAGTNLSTTNTTSKLQLTITIADLMNAASVEYYCTARNSLGTARSRFLSVHRACEFELVVFAIIINKMQRDNYFAMVFIRCIIVL